MSARSRPSALPPILARYVESAEASLAAPFKGLTADGTVAHGLFPIQAPGSRPGRSSRPPRALVASLGPEQRAPALFPVDADDAWRRWSNIHPFLMRHGVCLETDPVARAGVAG
jgi:hypothetical protein